MIVRRRQIEHVRRQASFTLIELIVTISIIVVLLALVVLIAPSISRQQKTAAAADKLQYTLLVAKQRAKRDIGTIPPVSKEAASDA